MIVPKNIKFPASLTSSIENEAALDHRTFSDEVRELVRLGLERRMKDRAVTADYLGLAAREGA